MEPATMEDDICILKHETACPAIESPVSGCPGDESLASHFALVTAYEDIKTRLRDAEQENASLRRRVRQLEDKVLSDHISMISIMFSLLILGIHIKLKCIFKINLPFTLTTSDSTHTRQTADPPDSNFH